jgi:hypothetical protein
MPRRFTYIIVEGPHDVEFIGKVLRTGPHAFHLKERKSDVDPFWHPLIPINYPVGKPPNDFLQRVPMPIFYQNATHSVAVQSANGISKIVTRLEESLSTPSFVMPDSIGIVLDSDSIETPVKRAAALAAEVAKSTPSLKVSWPTTPGNVVAPAAGQPRLGQFVLPDNNTQGTLEDILLQCGGFSYPTLMPLASQHIATAKAKLVPGTSHWTNLDHEELNAPAGEKKATIAAATALLKPGRTTQVSLNDNRWIEPATLARPFLKPFVDWLDALVI